MKACPPQTGTFVSKTERYPSCNSTTTSVEFGNTKRRTIDYSSNSLSNLNSEMTKTLTMTITQNGTTLKSLRSLLFKKCNYCIKSQTRVYWKSGWLTAEIGHFCRRVTCFLILMFWMDVTSISGF